MRHVGSPGDSPAARTLAAGPKQGKAREALIVAGPTASGKSALAATLAERLGGAIINADAMQLYRELRVLTARPSEAEEARLPHLLYGVRPAAEPASAAWWRRAALAAMEGAEEAGRLPILCGGSGLYLAALIEGLSEIPQPSAEARAEARALLAALGPAGLYARLAEADPATAARLRPSDSQRLARAFEVWRSTGRGLASWHAGGQVAGHSWRFRAILLDPPRAALHAAIEARFATMLAAGALEEVRALAEKNFDPSVPALRAHGVPELSAHLAGEIDLAEAARRAILVTGQYAKRQTTWFRHHALADTARTHMIHARIAGQAQLSEIEVRRIITFVQEAG
ncbi:MAG TPA: tRNA (adenosine(37)-N6)-dimethylallyltransferase MiaA [Acetobacteraceae bacterium]|nr:tRNA (adenosine(37)-N6)-dimethylallyltransferase MiaA [Acetobacteraceae bacterium]